MNLIKKKLHERLIKEFMSQDMIYLKNYFNLSDELKKDYLPHEYPEQLDNFLYDENINFELPKNTSNVDIDGYDIEEEMSHYEIIEWLFYNNKELFNKFGDWLFNKINNYELDIPDSDYPAWSFFDKPEILKNQWLIHFTNNANGIAREGFKYGVDEMSKLGLTTHLSQFDKQYGGYNFAYTLKDYLRYGKSGRSFKYGEEAVIFRASGIRIYHNSDQEYQTIFYGKTATNIIPITEEYGNEYAIHSKISGKILYQNDNFDNVVKWLINNFDQYRKHF